MDGTVDGKKSQGQPPVGCIKHWTCWWFFTNPFEKYAGQNGFIFPKDRDEHKKLCETAT